MSSFSNFHLRSIRAMRLSSGGWVANSELSPRLIPIEDADLGKELDWISRLARRLPTRITDSARLTRDVALIQEFAEGLKERDMRILEERILSDEPRTLAELGEDFGVSRERVRQLEARLIDGLRKYVKENMVDFEYYTPPPKDES